MTPNATAAPDASRDEIMASVDTTMGTREYIIADVTRDGAWRFGTGLRSRGTY